MTDDKQLMRSATKAVDHRTMPFDLVDLRSRLLDAADADIQYLGKLVKKALATLDAALDAEKETVLQWEGVVKGVHRAVDHQTRLRAATAVAEITGVAANRSNVPAPEAPKIGAVNVVVHLGDGETREIAVGGMAKAEKDVTPGLGTVNQS